MVGLLGRMNCVETELGLHLIKMAAGIESGSALEARQKVLRDRVYDASPKGDLVHVTRYFPKRRDEILAPHVEDLAVPGSIYWVFQKSIQYRQKISGFREVTGADGITRCAIVLEGPLIAVMRARKKAFQGWRYLTEADAPRDLGRDIDNKALSQAPRAMQDALLELCLM